MWKDYAGSTSQYTRAIGPMVRMFMREYYGAPPTTVFDYIWHIRGWTYEEQWWEDAKYNYTGASKC